jgi:hypothetical protein
VQQRTHYISMCLGSSCSFNLGTGKYVCILSTMYLGLGWSDRYTNSTVIITNSFTVTKYTFIKSQWILFLLVDFFLSFIINNSFTWVWLIRLVSYKKQELLTHRDHLFCWCCPCCSYYYFSVLLLVFVWFSNVVPVSLDCPSMIYLHILNKNAKHLIDDLLKNPDIYFYLSVLLYQAVSRKPNLPHYVGN